MDAKNVSKLAQNDILCILNVTKNIPFYDNLLPATSSSKFTLKRIAVNDCSTQNLKSHFDEAIEFIRHAKQTKSKVLVHCQAGISRSPTLVIAYLMKEYGKTMDDAYSMVRKKRPIIAPNLIFMSQLMDFETENAKTMCKSNSSKCLTTCMNGELKSGNLRSASTPVMPELTAKFPKFDRGVLHEKSSESPQSSSDEEPVFATFPAHSNGPNNNESINHTPVMVN